MVVRGREASASQQVQQVLHYIIARANSKVEHLPSPEKDMLKSCVRHCLRIT